MNIFEFRRLKSVIELNEEEIESAEQILKNLDYHMKHHFSCFSREGIKEHLEDKIKELHFNTQQCLSQIMNFDFTLEEFNQLDSMGYFDNEVNE